MKKHGFTLIELSIVLVIIGLIVGGVLVGRDLIRAAEIRSTVSQLEKYNTAVGTFRLKYNGIPGDLLYSQAASYGLFRVTFGTYPGYAGYGDGNGIITCSNGATYIRCPSVSLAGEPFMFWRQLSDANLIDGNYGSGLNTAAEATAPFTTNLYLPSAKIGLTTAIQVNALYDKNYYALSNISAILQFTSDTSYNSIPAIDAYALDSKMDDGMPATGIVFAINGNGNMNGFSAWLTLSNVATCVTSNAYALSPGTTPDCSLRVKFQ